MGLFRTNDLTLQEVRQALERLEALLATTRPNVFGGRVKKVGGTGGSKTVNPTWVYDFYDPREATFDGTGPYIRGTALSPYFRPALPGQYTAAADGSFGLALYDPRFDNPPILLIVQEYLVLSASTFGPSNVQLTDDLGAAVVDDLGNPVYADYPLVVNRLAVLAGIA